MYLPKIFKWLLVVLGILLIILLIGLVWIADHGFPFALP